MAGRFELWVGIFVFAVFVLKFLCVINMSSQKWSLTWCGLKVGGGVHPGSYDGSTIKVPEKSWSWLHQNLISILSNLKKISKQKFGNIVAHQCLWEFLLTRQSFHLSSEIWPLEVSDFFLFSVLHVYTQHSRAHKANGRTGRERDGSLLAGDNLSINNLEYNFYSSDLVRQITPKKYSESQTYLARFNLSWNEKFSFIFVYSIKTRDKRAKIV